MHSMHRYACLGIPLTGQHAWLLAAMTPSFTLILPGKPISTYQVGWRIPLVS